MKKVITIIGGVLFLFIASCSDSVDPKTAPTEDYIFYCIINADTTFQTAYLAKSYDVAGVDPLVNTTDPAITGANIKVDILSITSRTDKFVTVTDTAIAASYQFQDAATVREDTSRYKDGFHYYCSNNFDIKSQYINDVSRPIKVTVTLPNGKVLKSSAETIPVGDIFFDKYLYAFPPEDYVKMIEFQWSFYSTKNSISKYCFFPSLVLYYSILENGVMKPYSIKIPYMTVSANGEDMLVYPSLTRTNYIRFNKQYVQDALAKISQGVADKSTIYIHKMNFIIGVLDQNVASYYASNTTFDDEFSVRVDAADVSNIKGGHGLFGVFSSRIKEVKFEKAYIEGLGYNYQP